MARQQRTARHEVAIVGGGSGGLALAHGFRQAGVDVAVFERDHGPDGGLQGYRMDLSYDGSKALHRLVPPRVYELLVATAALPPRSLTFFDQRLDVLLRLDHRDGLNLVADGPIGGLKSVNRLTVRKVLMTDLDDVVHFDTTFDRYEVRPDGKVEARFGGTRVVADLLVGADGSGSAVREQLLPGAQPRDTGMAIIAARVPLAGAPALPMSMRDGVSLILGDGPYRCIVCPMEFPPSAHELIAGDFPSDYLIWGLHGSRRRLRFDPLALRGRDLSTRSSQPCPAGTSSCARSST